MNGTHSRMTRFILKVSPRTVILVLLALGGLLFVLNNFRNDNHYSQDFAAKDSKSLSNGNSRTQNPKESEADQKLKYEKSKSVNIPDTKDEGLRRIHVVITFPLYTVDLNHGAKGNGEQVTRMKEYIQSLKEFLENENVKHVYLLHDDDGMEEFINTHFDVQPRLSLHRKESVTVVLTLHQFAFEHLQNKLVFITNADIFMGPGFEQIDAAYVQKNKVMYALSRSIKKDDSCKAGIDQCFQYIGSHDSYVFVPQGTINEKAASLLKHHFYQWGTENVIMHVYQHNIGYKVTNPCKVLRIYHGHCGNYRDSHDRQRVNSGGVSLVVSPSDTLMVK